MIAAGEVISWTGVTAALLSPVCLAYCLLTLKRDDGKSRTVRVLGILAVIQCVAVLIYMATIWREMSRTGLGL